ncbi:unnamed protein product, partial [Ectocarpus sp. 12 AP-2014]
AYTGGHLDLKLQHTLLSTPARPPAEVLRMEDVASGPSTDPRRGSSSPHASPCQNPVSRGQNTRIRPDSRRYQHPNNTPPC